jgi:transcriptional regulator with XRE-family HTH domain
MGDDSSVSQKKTLAQWVQQLRDNRSLTQSRLAELTHLPLSQIQDIEAGIELFLSPAVRQKLARVLKTSPQGLKALEKPLTPQQPILSLEGRNRLIEEMLHFPHETYPCPQCQTPLMVRLFHRKDLEDNPLLEIKAHCEKCLFKL